MKVAFFTLGCKVNQYESEVLLEQFVQAGFTSVSFEEVADVYVVNTCTVTAVSDKKSRQMLRRAKKQNHDAVVVAAGCYPQTAKEEVERIPEIDIAVGSANKYKIIELVQDALQSKKRIVEIYDNLAYTPYGGDFVQGRQGRTRASIKIQDGCNNFCAYCIIPYARGRVRSKSIADVVHEFDTLLKAGFQEIVLTGIEVCSYGADTGERLIDLLSRLNTAASAHQSVRIRLGSLEPRVATKEFIGTLSTLKNICPQYHLALQSGCDATLKRMNRRYTCAEYRETVQLLRESIPDVTITTDIMTGFPGETEEEFETTCRFAEEIGFLKIHVFPYSIRKGTRAAAMEHQVPKDIKEERAKKLSEIGMKSREALLSTYVGKTLSVLFEEEVSPGVYEGYSENYIPVRVCSNLPLGGETRPVRITGTDGETCFGELIY